MSKKNMRRISVLVTAQTAYHLQALAKMAGYKEPGRVIDKLIREHMILTGKIKDQRGKWLCITQVNIHTQCIPYSSVSASHLNPPSMNKWHKWTWIPDCRWCKWSSAYRIRFLTSVFGVTHLLECGTLADIHIQVQWAERLGPLEAEARGLVWQ